VVGRGLSSSEDTFFPFFQCAQHLWDGPVNDGFTLK
jgi:hypothetical protein